MKKSPAVKIPSQEPEPPAPLSPADAAREQDLAEMRKQFAWVDEWGGQARELLLRFSDDPILITPPSSDEIAIRIRALGRCVTGEEIDINSERVRTLAAQAVASECPMQWLEAYTTTQLKRMRSLTVRPRFFKRIAKLRPSAFGTQRN